MPDDATHHWVQLKDLAAAVRTVDDLRRFVDVLRIDLKDHESEWANGWSVEAFLDALARFAADHRTTNTAVADELSLATADWRLVANLLLAPRIYE